MLKLKIHIHEILNNNFRLELPKFNKWIVNLKGTNLVVIGASQSIRKTCEWSLLISEILSLIEYKWKYCFYVLYFQVCKEQQSVHLSKVTNKLITYTLPRARMELSFSNFSRWHHRYCQSKFHMITVMASLEITLEYIYIYKFTKCMSFI
jgi:hypothetical protein